MDFDYKPNIDITKAFSSTVMAINDEENAENGITYVQAGADGPPIHKHPTQEENFRVLAGNLEVYRVDRWIKLSAGEEIHIPKNTAHTFRSRDKGDCYFEYVVTPKGNFTGMLQTFEKLMAADKIRSNSDPRSLVYLAMTFKEHEEELVSVNPPQFVMTAMAGVGKMLGCRI